MRKLLAIGMVLTALLALLTGPASAGDPPWVARARGGMVASDSPEASRIGAAVLAGGGNAFDAAVATSLALAVARPQSTGLGGGGFLVAYVAREGRFVALDYRETAPASATPQRFARLDKQRGDGPAPSVYGGNAVAVPGLVAGLAEINRRWGTRPLRELTAPAIELAERGFVVDDHFVGACREVLADFGKWPVLTRQCRRMHEFVKREVAHGQRLKRPALAEALRLLASDGPAAFYQGEIGQAIVRAVNAAGGELTLDDLRGYRVVERRPLVGRYFTRRGNFTIVSMPPPSSGGVCLIEMFNILEAARQRPDAAAIGRWHLLTEALKHAFADRARWLGDPDRADLPVARLTSKGYATELAARIDPQRTRPPEYYGSGPPARDGGTSHFCVVDRWGNIVSITETINGLFGSLVVAEPYGIILNNEMDDFLTVPGKANMFGLRQSQANLVGPGRRPLSSMAPTIVLRYGDAGGGRQTPEGRPVLVIGAAGGPRIISAVFNVTLAVIERQDLPAAMQRPRLHHQWRPDRVYFDRSPPSDAVAELERCGHTIARKRKGGVVQAIELRPDGELIGVSDPAKGGRPAGVD